ncbi:MAG: HlyD family secretion protein [Pannonibacter sp.]
MLEILLCSLVTILPDYLYRRFVQGKRLGSHITLFSVWYELRVGITACLILAVSLIAVIFYNHPSTMAATAYFRAVPIAPETIGRVAEVKIGVRAEVKAGDILFRLDDSAQQAALSVAERRIAEIDASMVMAEADVAAADGQLAQARAALDNAEDELRTKQELAQRNASVVAPRDLERLQRDVETRQGAVTAADAARQAALTRLTTLLPAQKQSAEAQRDQARVELAKTVIRAGVDGRVEQFTLRVGDLVNPLARPAGVLIPSGAGRRGVVAGFNQIEGQVIKAGMTGEITCVSKPWTVIPMVITEVQDVIAAGQVRATDQLIDPMQVTRPGTLTVYMEPMFQGGMEGVVPGSSCIANAYTSNHDKLEDPSIGTGTWVYLHVVDTVALVHAIILRGKAFMLPIRELVLSGH